MSKTWCFFQKTSALIIKHHQVFNSGSIKSASEHNANFSGLRKKGSSPSIHNSLTSKFAAIDFGKIKRIFWKEYRVPKIELPIEELNTGGHDGTIDMDSIINSALVKHENAYSKIFCLIEFGQYPARLNELMRILNWKIT